MKKRGLNRYVYNFSVDYMAFDINDITTIHKYLMKKTWYKLIVKIFIGM